jgi:transposase
VPAALYYASRDRRHEHPVRHLHSFTGILQADAYNGYNELYDPARPQGPIISALCWAHARRQFFELANIATNARRGKNASAISPIALEAVKRIDILFDIERDINGHSAEQRLRVRREQSAPLLAGLEVWLVNSAPVSRAPLQSPSQSTTCCDAGIGLPDSSMMDGTA